MGDQGGVHGLPEILIIIIIIIIYSNLEKLYK